VTALLDAVGGRDVVVVVVDGFYERLVSDPAVRHHFAPDRMASLKAAQVRWFEAVLQGDPPPADLRDVHAHLDITDDEVDIVIAHLADVLLEIDLDPRLRRAIMALVSRLWHARAF
jgi:hemoglobin